MVTLLHLLLAAVTSVYAANNRIINGTPADPAKFKEVVRFPGTGGGSCTGTLVGPRVLVTAAHCAPNGSIVKFVVGGKEYSAKLTRSTHFPATEHNLAVGLVDKEVSGVEFANIGGKSSVGLEMAIFGYGCTSGGATTGSDALLYGKTIMREVQAHQVKSKADKGAVICFGDAGGPAYVFEGNKKLLIGVNSHGNQIDENSTTRTDISESDNLFRTFITANNNVEICGVNKNCTSSVTPTPTPTPAPQCNVSVTPQSSTLGLMVTAKLTTSGQVTEAYIDGSSVSFPNGEKSFKPGSAGTHTVRGMVKGPGGDGNCENTYTVTEPGTTPAPTCQLVANPSQIKTGEKLMLVLTVMGSATSASIQGTSVSATGGSITIAPTSSGTATATVSSSSGSNNCSASYTVTVGTQPNVPNYTIVPTYCGENLHPESGILNACLGFVKYSWARRGLQIKDVVLLTHSDNTKEVMPIIYQHEFVGTEKNIVKAELGLYANGFNDTLQGLQLKIKKGEIVKDSGIPISLSGWSGIQGKIFVIEKLKPSN